MVFILFISDFIDHLGLTVDLSMSIFQQVEQKLEVHLVSQLLQFFLEGMKGLEILKEGVVCHCWKVKH